MKTPITYYGGKQQIAQHIIELIPNHRIYVEPYFGGGAVFFQKSKSYLEVINDHDNNLINFYIQCKNNYEYLKQLIDNTLNCESQYKYAKDIWNNNVPATDIEKAWAIWLLTNGSFNSTFHGGWKWSNGASGSHTGVFIANKVNDFDINLKSRLQHVQISCRDALKVIKERDTVETLFYLDPPYPGTEQKHYSGFTHKDLDTLLKQLSTIKGKFILSNYWSQTLRYHILKNGWKYKKIEISIKSNNFTKRGLQKRTEILVWNYEEHKMF